MSFLSRPRPTMTDEVVLWAYAEALLEAGILEVDEPRFDTAHALVSAIEKHPRDAYLQACALEGAGYPVNEDVVQHLMNGRRGLWLRVFRDAVRSWVIEEGIRFPAVEGDEVLCEDPVSGMSRPRKVIGVLPGEAAAFVQDGTAQPIYLAAEHVVGVYKDSKSVLTQITSPVAMTVGFRCHENAEVAVGG